MKSVVADLGLLERRNMNDEKMLYTVKEASAVLGVNIHIIYDLIKKGLLPALKLGSLKIRKQTLESFLEKYEGMDLSDLDNISALNIIV